MIAFSWIPTLVQCCIILKMHTTRSKALNVSISCRLYRMKAVIALLCLLAAQVFTKVSSSAQRSYDSLVIPPLENTCYLIIVICTISWIFTFTFYCFRRSCLVFQMRYVCPDAAQYNAFLCSLPKKVEAAFNPLYIMLKVCVVSFADTGCCWWLWERSARGFVLVQLTNAWLNHWGNI